MASFFLRASKSRFLKAQIQDAERQVSLRQRQCDARTVALIGQIHRQMTAPASLLLAGGIGFIAGELSRPPLPNAQGEAKASPLKTALDLLASARTLYAALPLAWMAKSFSASRRHAQPEPPISIYTNPSPGGRGD